MNHPLWLLAAVAAVVALMIWQRARRRRALDEQQVARWLDADLPWRAWLDDAQRARHLAHTRRLVRRVHFHGCAGQEVDARMAVTIGGLAALLTLRARSPMPNLHAVLVYPGPFWVPQDRPDEDGLVDDEVEVLHSGLSEDNGRVLLSWDDIRQALAGAEHNVAVHEFAHQLDALSGGEGAPAGAPAERWSQVMHDAWTAFERHPSSVIDDYALEGPAEFFAVAVEAFFQRPAVLAAEHRALHDLLARYFGLMPGHLPFA
ncbi:zinc-dependent peptidase [Algiphilus sp.]|uniref:M90 family metallopeptidase n=1 Tax=Algiphilus sp. TaxID=1872431 RepID=UPI0025BC1764|nr:M90 family metallopeptidase [Algiphilus sp.]MCK5771563.1 zinc-dependent peptidase [Algiphilus sp.]